MTADYDEADVEAAARGLVPETVDPDRSHGTGKFEAPLWTFYVDDAKRAVAAVAPSIAAKARAAAFREAARNLPMPADPYGGFDHESLRAAHRQVENWLNGLADIARDTTTDRSGTP